MRVDSRRTGEAEQERRDSFLDDDSMAEDWNVQLLGGLPREDGEENPEPVPPSAARGAPPSPAQR